MNFAAAVTELGGLYMWGNNAYGQLGVYERVEPEIHYPKKVMIPDKCLMVACGLYHTVAIARHYIVYSWGNNTSGQLGIGELVSHYKPQVVEALSGQCCTYVVCGIDNSMAVTEDGRVFGWGNNAYYKMGLEKNPYKPEYISTGRNLLSPLEFTFNFEHFGRSNEYPKQLRLQKTYSMCLSSFDRYFWWGLTPVLDLSQYSDSDLRKWLFNEPGKIYGLQRVNPENDDKEPEVKKEENHEGAFYLRKAAGRLVMERIILEDEKTQGGGKREFFSKIGCGENYTMVLTKFGELIVWGSNLYGQHGTSSEDISKAYQMYFTTGAAQKTEKRFRVECFPHFIPAFNVTNNRRVTHFSCGARHVIAIQNSISAFSWGDNQYGQLGLGLGSTNKVNNPQRIVSVSGREILECYAGDDVSVILTTEGQPFICGSNKDGKLGLGYKDKDNRISFEPIQTLQKVRKVAVGKNHLLAVCEVENLQPNIFDELADLNQGKKVNKDEDRDKQTDLYAWGNGSMGQLGLEKAENVNFPVKIEIKGDFTMISAGEEHSAAVTSDKKLYVWGHMDYLPSDVESQLRNSQGDEIKFKSTRGGVNFIKKPYELKKKVDTTFIMFSDIQLSSKYNLVLGDDNSSNEKQIYHWGTFLNEKNDTGDDKYEPRKRKEIKTFSNFNTKEVSAAYDHAACISYDGQRVYCWGIDNYSGKLGSAVEIVKNKKETKKQKDLTNKKSFDPLKTYFEAQEVKCLYEILVQRVEDVHNKRNPLGDSEDKQKSSVNKSMGIGESTNDHSTLAESSLGQANENNKQILRQRPQNLLSDEYLEYLKLLAQQSFLAMIKLLEEYSETLQLRGKAVQSIKNILFSRLIEEPFSLAIRDPWAVKATSLASDPFVNLVITHTLTALQLHPCLLIKLVEPAIVSSDGKCMLEPEELANFIWQIYGSIHHDERKEILYSVLFEGMLELELRGAHLFSEILIFEDKMLSTMYATDENSAKNKRSQMKSIRYSIALLMKAIENSFDIANEIDVAYVRIYNEINMKIKSIEDDAKKWAFVMWEIKEMSGTYKAENQSWKVEEFIERINNLKRLTGLGLLGGFGGGKKGFVPSLLMKFHSCLMSHKELKDYKEKDQIKILWGFLLYPLKNKIELELKKMDSKEAPKFQHNLRHSFIFLMHYYTGSRFTLQPEDDSKEVSKDAEKWVDKITEILFSNGDLIAKDLRSKIRDMCQPGSNLHNYITPIDVEIEGRGRFPEGEESHSVTINKDLQPLESDQMKPNNSKNADKDYLTLDERQATTFKDFFLYIEQIFGNLPERVTVKKDYLYKVFSQILNEDGVEKCNVFEDVGLRNIAPDKSPRIQERRHLQAISQ